MFFACWRGLQKHLTVEDSDYHQSVALVISNDDLLTEILIRLPVTSILRFKSVSKRWRLLLTHKHFTRRYDNNNNISKSVGLFGRNIYVPFDVENRRPPPFRSLDFYFNRSNVEIWESCNGLLLCRDIQNDIEYCVFNPTTKQLAPIPSVPNYIWSMALAYHPTECVHYKLVCVIVLDSEITMFQIQIYSSETMKWKVCIESFSGCTTDSFHHSPVYWNNSVHWAPGFLNNNFLYFKLDVEELQMLPVPEELVSTELSTMYFGESRGHLHFISRTNCQDRISNLNVYEMLRDRSGWFLKYRVQFDELPGFPYMVTYDSLVVDVVRSKEEDEEEEETFLVLVTSGNVMRYNVHDKSFNEIYSQTDDYDIYCTHLSFHRYIEALSSF